MCSTSDLCGGPLSRPVTVMYKIRRQLRERGGNLAAFDLPCIAPQLVMAPPPSHLPTIATISDRAELPGATGSGRHCQAGVKTSARVDHGDQSFFKIVVTKQEVVPAVRGVSPWCQWTEPQLSIAMAVISRQDSPPLTPPSSFGPLTAYRLVFVFAHASRSVLVAMQADAGSEAGCGGG